MTYNEKQYAAAVKYKAKNIKRIPLDVQITEYEIIKAAADRAGMTVNGYIKQAIREKLNHGPDHIKPNREVNQT